MEVVKKEKKAWTNLRSELNNDDSYNDNWAAAIELFEDRLQKKYFEPIQSLIDEDKLQGEGFSILTVQCALIEMFAAFNTGQIFNHKLNKQSPFYEYKNSSNLFTSFLLSEDIFRDHFWVNDSKGAKIENSPYNALEFYSDVRCGLMHEARTKGNWAINAVSISIEKQDLTTFIKQKNGEAKIYRTVLHYKLLEYLNSYKKKLEDDNGNELRKFFARKLDNLFDYTEDNTYFWWK